MTVLSAQSIRNLCIMPEYPLLYPFVERGTVNGKSYGLSACTYDCRIDQDLVLYPMPWEYCYDGILSAYRGDFTSLRDTILNGKERIKQYKALASTVERFAIPDNVCGSVLDKSSYARVFVSAFNTHLDPGWEGFLTVELVNLGDDVVIYRQGDPVCQVKFEWLDEPTELPYRGKYQDQEPGPQSARHEP